MTPSTRSSASGASSGARGHRPPAAAALVVCAAACLALLGLPRAARADEEDARLHFERAQMAYKLGKYLEAIEGYEAAYRAMPDPAFLFNIAQSHRQQYRIDHKAVHLQKALSLYKSYLREMPGARNKETVHKLIDELKSLLTAMEDRARDEEEESEPARLILRGGPETNGAEVTVDDEPIGALPLSRKLEPGAHLVKVTRPGYAPWSTTVNLKAGAEVELPVLLQKEAGRAEGPAGPPPSTPVYKRWWFWTVVGAVVVGGAGTGIYFATRDRGAGVPAMPEIDLR